jgi:hypothetical protein
MLVGIGDLHLDINREGIYTGILQPVKVDDAKRHPTERKPLHFEGILYIYPPS